MLNNKDFYKTLNALFIESDKTQIESFSLTLEKLFKSVVLKENLEDALEEFSLNKSNIDIIFCDIKLEETSGLTVLDEVRRIDDNIPFLLTAESIEADELLKAINLDVSDFLIKPIENESLLKSIEKVCKVKYHDKFEENVQKDLEDVISVVNEVALVTKTNLDGNIIFANKSFCECSGYKEDELLGQKHELIRDINRLVSEELSQTIRSGNIWEGKIKNISKNKEEFYVYLTVIPLFDDYRKIKEFIWIRFLATEYELEQKNFKKKVAQNINENRRINTQARDKIDELLNKLNTYKSLDFSIDEELKRKERIQNQSRYFEKLSKDGEEKLKEITTKAKDKISSVVLAQQQTKKEKDETSGNLNICIEEFQLKTKTVKELISELDNQKKLIEKLKLKIDNRENKLGLKD